MKKCIYTCLLLSLPLFPLQAQLFIDNTIAPEQMVMDFFTNSCITPSNITYNGAPISIAYFEGANTDLGINAGIVISSGDVEDLSQTPENMATANTSSDGDIDLEALLNNEHSSYDAAVLEFDIMVSEEGLLNFEYIFGSEEYPEFVGLGFNDVFGFFVGEESTSLANIAYVPNTMTPVAINNVNEQMNAQYYVPYGMNGGTDLVFDGLTTKLPATFSAQANASYHVKIAVADIGDRVLDSGVFIGIESLCGESELTPPAEATALVDGQTVAFSNLSRYATSWHWDFGDNTSSKERFPAPHLYGQEGTYTVTLTTENWCCTDTYTFTVDVGSTNTEERIEKPFEVQPNPASDHIVFQSETTKNFTYELTDYTGKMVLANTISGGAAIPLAELHEGIYLLRVIDGQQTFVEKILIRR